MSGFDDFFPINDFVIEDEAIERTVSEDEAFDTGIPADIFSTGERQDIFSTLDNK